MQLQVFAGIQRQLCINMQYVCVWMCLFGFHARLITLLFATT